MKTKKNADKSDTRKEVKVRDLESTKNPVAGGKRQYGAITIIKEIDKSSP